MPWVKLKRWIGVYLKRRRREWKLKAALAGLGAGSQMAALTGSGGPAPKREMSDAERVAALTTLGMQVDRQRGPQG